MHGNRKFDVIQTVEQGGQCHPVLNNITGRTLEEMCREEGYISRDIFYEWSIQIVGCLENLHRCRPVKIYQFLTPYTVIIGSDKKVYLLDTEHESNREIIRGLFDKMIQAAFFPEGSIGRRHPGVYHDLYSAGKIIQYMLAKTEASQEMGRIEEIRMEKIIQKLTDTYGMKSLHTASDVKILLIRCRGKSPVDKDRKRKERKQDGKSVWKYRKYVAVTAAVVIMIAGVQVLFSQASSSHAASVDGSAKESSNRSIYSADSVYAAHMSESDGDVTELNLKLGLLYYEKLKDYETSLMYFRKAAQESERAAAYETLAKYNIGNYGILESESEAAVQEILIIPEEFTEMEKTEAFLDAVWIYDKMGQKEKSFELIKDRISALEKWKEGDTNGTIRKELYEKAVVLYQDSGNLTKAIETTIKLYDEAQEETDFEAQCVKLSELYYQNHQYAEGETVSLTGIDKCIRRTKVALISIKCICDNDGYDEAQKEEKITGILQKVPELEDDSEWQEMIKEKNLHVKDGNVYFLKDEK